MFHVEQFFSPNIGTVHHFQTGATFEGDEAAGELFCRIMINRMNYPTEILSIEFADLVNILDPNGDMLDFHISKFLWLATKAEEIGSSPF